MQTKRCFSVFITLLLLAFLFVLTACNTKEAEGEFPPVTQEKPKPLPLYTVREKDGKIAVFEKNSEEPKKEYHTYVADLPDEDQTSLAEGILVYNEEELRQLIEDLTS